MARQQQGPEVMEWGSQKGLESPEAGQEIVIREAS